jgi:hypothetical protein
LYHLASIHDEFTRFDLEHAALDSLYEYSASYAIDAFRLARAAQGLREISRVVEVSY